ncbi:GTP-binding protein 8-like [Acanthaster planci]|uniref:GTP-binding protein 8 n=1 Tax=Acanthaster planci TaxID=133434 RepID=A0A8B7Y3G6_ACAPL|nr:GTP-binding protein 8-like [Acanthaster planci]XP_022086861.1 GTP-binding protein 8-like [Acanthaster planci]
MMTNSLQTLKVKLLRRALCAGKQTAEMLGCRRQQCCHLHQRQSGVAHPLPSQTGSRTSLVRACIEAKRMHCHFKRPVGTAHHLKMHSRLHGDREARIHLHLARMTSSQQSSQPALNPLFKLQPFLTQPILKDAELIFTPSEADIARATALFVSSASHRIEFVRGAYYPEEAPNYNLPEIAFIGRSNVGKSSLIKALFSEIEGLKVRTSKTPGHTKLLLFFQVGRAFSLVDMPGYGYRQPANFITSAEGFLKSRKNLRNTFLLVDSFVGLKQWDYVAIEMLEEFAIPYLVVLTKSDKATRRQLIENIMTVSRVIRENTQGCLPQPFLVSAKSGEGLPFLKGFIAYTTGNL